MDILNLGAGNRLVSEAVNHDLRKHRPEIDIAWDLNDLPWPWEDSSFDKVVAWAVLEHLDISLLVAIDEIWRILKPGGILQIKLPWCKNEDSYNDPSHRYAVGRGIFDVFDPTTLRGSKFGFYTGRRWNILESYVNKIGTCIVGRLEVIK